MTFVPRVRVPLDSPPMAISIEQKPWVTVHADTLYGWDGESSEPIWTTPLPRGTQGASLLGRALNTIAVPLYNEGRLHVIAVDAATGAIQWELFDSNRRMDRSQIAVADGTLALTGEHGSDDVIFGVDLATGKLAFEHENEESNVVAAAAGTFFVSGHKSLRPFDHRGVRPAVMPISFAGLRVFGALLVGSHTDRKTGVTSIVAFDAEQMAAAGRIEIGHRAGVVRIFAGGALGRVLVTASGATPEILLLDLRTETVVWRTSIAPWGALSAAWVEGCVVASLAGAMENLLPRAILLDPSTGAERPNTLEMAYPAHIVAAEGDAIILRLAGLERLRWE